MSSRAQDPPGAVESLDTRLHAAFAREVAAAHDRIPDVGRILLMARIDAVNRRTARLAAVESWADVAVVGTVGLLSAIWWEDAISGLEEMFPIAMGSMSWTAGLGVAVGLLAAGLIWSKTLARSA